MSQPDSLATEIVAKAEALLSKIRADLNDSLNFYRENEIDPDKVELACSPYLGPAQKNELSQMLEEDALSIQRDVDEASAHLRGSDGGPASRIRMRNSV